MSDMENNELKENFSLYLFAIKQAFESGKFSHADCETLTALFKHSMLYRSVLDNELICDAHTRARIVEFCKLIEDGLPAPEILASTVLHLALVKGNPHREELSLPSDLRACADKLFRAAGIDLMAIFQISILDLSVKLSNGPLPAEDVENAHYVMGMAEITAINLGKIIDGEHDFGELNFGNLQKFFVDSTGFAGSLRASGLGMVG